MSNSTNNVIEETTFQEILISFNDSLREANKRSSRLYESFVQQVRIAYWLTILLYLSAYLGAIALVVISVYFALQTSSSLFMHIFSFADLLLGTIAIILIFLNHPLRSMRRSLIEMMKIDFIYSGYTRQLYQIDAEFKKQVTNEKSLKELRILIKQTQSVVDQVVENLSISLEETLE
jgi:hypothetical protein